MYNNEGLCVHCITCGTPRLFSHSDDADDEQRAARDSFKNIVSSSPLLSSTEISSALEIEASEDSEIDICTYSNYLLSSESPIFRYRSPQKLLLTKNGTYSNGNAEDRNNSFTAVNYDDEKECRRLLINIHVAMNKYTDIDEVFVNLSQLAQSLASSSDMKYRTLALNDQSVRDKFGTLFIFVCI